MLNFNLDKMVNMDKIAKENRIDNISKKNER